ncbi:MAG: hypothetical protein HUJ53_01450, partial [Holdemanella sp.]|nr:hypothetical protein [Holdemanella sp.]
MAVLIKTDRNGTKTFRGLVKCERCGGMGGHDKWAYTGWSCYKCGGTGLVEGTWKEYTPEYQAKLDAERAEAFAKQEAEWQAEQARIEAEAEEKRQAEELAKQAEEERIKAEKAISKFVGQIGDKIDLHLNGATMTDVKIETT